MNRDWNKLEAALRSGTIGRREFLAGAAALGIVGGLATEALAQVPKRGGHLVAGINQAGTTDTFDPGTYNADFPYFMGNLVYDPLTVVNPKSELMPALAESWEQKDGAKTWVFKIRKGVTFHNGKALTASDVVYSLNFHRGADSKSAAKSFFTSVTNIVATTPNEVTVTLDSGDVDFPFAMADFHLLIGPEGTKWDGIGTGAFSVENFEPGVRILTKRFANDWRKDRGYLDSIEGIAINDPSARLSALLSGSAHVVNRVPFASVTQIEADSRFQIFSITGGSHPTMDPMTNAAPYNNLDLRLAIAYAADRDAILKTVFRGYGKLGNDQPVPSYMPEYAADIPQRQYDPDKAKFHLKKSGYDGAITFTVSDTASFGAVESAQIVQASATKAGLNFQVDRVPNDGYYAKYWRKVPFSASTYGGRSTANIVLNAEFASTSGLNGSFWKNDKFDQLLVASRIEIDPAKRKQMYHDMQQLIHDEVGSLILVFNNNIEAGSKKVKGYVPSPVQQLGAYRGLEALWLSDT